ncbi:MAG: Flp family type IVb pilin [Phycisphaerales bacterium]|nr:Flp family type IVb pilin [Hyphomonadaceae bacterium]
MIARFLRDERGATAIEYGLIAVLLSVAIIGGVSLVGTSVQNSFADTAAKVTAATD